MAVFFGRTDSRSGCVGRAARAAAFWRSPGRKGALGFFVAALATAAVGVAMAVRGYPGDFDWMYTVLSHLASPRRNPEGGRWLSGAVVVAVFLLWPVVNHLGRRGVRESVSDRGLRLATFSLRAGLVAGALLGMEGITGLRFSEYLHKAHEALALLAFLAFYGGVLGHHGLLVRAQRRSILPAVLVVVPILAAGIAQLGLYLDQRDLGWVNTDWRELGVPLWMSFAFWQWIALGCLAFGLGFIVLSARERGGG